MIKILHVYPIMTPSLLYLFSVQQCLILSPLPRWLNITNYEIHII